MKFIPTLLFCLFAALGLAAQEKIDKSNSSSKETRSEFVEARSGREAGQQQEKRDSVLSLEKSRQIAGINDSYRLDATRKIAALETLNQYNARQRNELILIATCLVVALTVLLIYFARTRKLNKQLTNHEQQLQELNSMKDKIFSVIGHDLRGPIARIPVALEIIDDEETSLEEKKFLIENLKEHSKVALETFDKLL